MFITWVPGTLFIGIGALVLFTLLSNWKRPPLPRWLALAVAVFIVSIVVRYFEAMALSSGDVNACDWGCLVFKVRWSWLYWGMAAAAWYFIERSARRLAALREAELDRSRLEAQMIEARLQVMQAQVEPHFLFNTLAHIKWLYQTDPLRGRRMLRSFRSYLRAALPQMRGMRSTLGREVELARAYLETQHTRMGRRLLFVTEIAPELFSAAFPPMMLLSLVENAIKHGLNPLPEGGRIEIRAEMIDDTLQLVVADTGVGLSLKGRAGGTGIGLSNIRSRLSALYGTAARLMLESNIPRGVVARIELPLRRAHTSRAAHDEGDALRIPA
jgi:LytS/YehU family sensor histidine kinase